MATTVSSLVVEVGSNITGLTSGLSRADREIGGFVSGVGAKMRSMGSSVTGLGAQFTALTAPLGLALGAGLNIASEFDSVMAEIGARTGLTADELAKVSDFALQMGADTSFSGQQAADAMLQLLSSGQNVEQAMATLPAILDAAAASGEALGPTADTITDIMAAFGLQAGIFEDGTSHSAMVVEALAKAAGASSASMGDLGQGFANVGGVAKTYGLNVKRTAAVLALLAENGVKGAEGGTALKSMLLNMTRPTEDVQNAWAELGTSFYDSEGNARDLTDVLADIQTGMEDMTVEEQNELMVELGGSYGVVALQALLGATSIEEMEAAMDGAAGAGDVAAARMDTFAGRVDSLMGSVETLAIKALTPFMNEVLKPLAEDLTEVANAVGTWVDENPELANQLVGIAAAALVIGPGLVVAGIGISAAGVALSALGAGIALVTSPLFLAAAGFVALGAGLAYVWTQDVGGVRTKIEDIGGAFRDADIGTAATDFKDKITGAITDVTSTDIDYSGIQTWAQTNMDTIATVVVGVAGIVFGGPLGMAIGAAKLISTAIDQDFLGIGTFLNDSGITANVETAFNNLKTGITDIMTRVFSPSQPVITQDMIERGVGGSQGGGGGGALGLFVSDLRLGLDWLAQELPKITGPISDGLSALGDGIGGFIDSFAGTETEGLLRIATSVGAAIGLIVTKLAEVGASLVGEALTNIGEALPHIGAFISDFISALSRLGEGDFAGAAQRLGEGVLSFVDAGLALIGLDFEPIITTITGLWDSVSAGIDAFKTGISEAFNWVKLNVLDPIKASIDAIKLALDGLVGGLGAYGGAADNLGAALNSGASPGDFLSALGTAIGQELGIPGAAVGAKLQTDGLVYGHADERILNAAETRDYESGGGRGSGGGGGTVNIYGVQDIEAILAELRRQGIDLQALAGR